MNLQKYLSQRDAQKNVIELYLTKLDEEKAKETISHINFNGILEKLETKVIQMEQLNEKIVNLTDNDDMQTEILETETYMLELELKVRYWRDVREKQSGLQPSDVNGTRQLNVNANPFVSQTVSNVSNSHTSFQYHGLPKLSLLSFDGSILQWQSFWDSFESTVHNNGGLTDVQKFSYLKNQLEGEAARTIEGFTLTNGNYTCALNLLIERFGQEHKIVHATMQALLKIAVPTSTISSLRNFHDKMEAYIRSLESLGQKQDSFGSLLVPIILDKLPSEMKRNLARVHCDMNWSLAELRCAIHREISILEAGNSSSLQNPMYEYGTTAAFLTEARYKGRNRDDNPENSRRDYPPSTEYRHFKSTLRCAYCADSHGSSDYKKYVNIESRLNIVKEKQLCFNCLGKHQVANCRSRGRCQNCQKKHHTSICKPEQSSNSQNATTAQPDGEVTRQPKGDISVMHSSSPSDVLLKTGTVSLRSGGIYAKANVLFDEGSQRSFITQDLADQLHLPVTSNEQIHISSFGNHSNKTMHLASATVHLLTDDRKTIPVQVLIVPTIASPMNISLVKNVSRYRYLAGLRFAHVTTDEDIFNVSLLIGADYYWHIVEDHVIRGIGPTAVKSKIGYLLSGPVPDHASSQTNHIMNVITSRVPDEQALERFWTLESMGITPGTAEDKTENPLQKYQESSITYDKGKYIAKLPWKQDHITLPTNYMVTLRRTENTVKRLSREPDMLKTYAKIIDEQEKRGFIERVPDDSKLTESRPVHYIPHHPVKKDSTTTPVRIVYDCSCRQSRGHASLNDCLESTPPQLNDITSLLVRFRLHRYAVITDIEKAFLNIVLHGQDRDVTRFLWLSDPTDPKSPLTAYRFKSVLFGATCSPFILDATINKHLQRNSDVKAADVISRDLYVDNVLSSFNSETELLTYYSEARELMKKAGMNLRSWLSNNENLRDLAADDNVLDTDAVAKVLGMRWDPKTDVLTFADRDISILESATKRDILKFTSRVYDPLGILSPVTVRAKILMQDLWKEEIEWDAPLQEKYTQAWNNLATDLKSASNILLQRQLIQETGSEHSYTQLHIFVDASIKSYGTAAYITSQNHTRLVMAKNRVAPVKKLTLPQLELMAAVVGARLYNHLHTTLSINNVTFWSDSQIVLYWLSTSKQTTRFVRNRVEEIKKLTNSHTWRYCPTKHNPADLLTRGISANEFKRNELWHYGPLWLPNESEWPVWDNDSHNSAPIQKLDDDQTLLMSQTEKQTTPVTSLQCLADDTSTNSSLTSIINIENYSNCGQLLHLTALVTRFTSNCRAKPTERLYGYVTAREIDAARMIWIRDIQLSEYHDTIQSLKSSKSKQPIIRQLRLFLDNDGLLRCGGRIHNSQLPEVTKFPYLLPDKHYFTKLLIRSTHEKLLHVGTASVVTHLRQQYWVPAIRRCVNSVLKRCVTCRKVTGKPYDAPDSPPLPKIRVADADPFKITGVDFTGNLYVRDDNGKNTKAYICLFTCATTRAIHLEVVPDLSTDSFMQAFRRFSSRHSVPEVMVSDNATTFEAAAQQIQRLSVSRELHDFLSSKGTEWRFIPKRAPWHGGFWERMIGITKEVLKKVLGRLYVNYQTLQTIVTEIEAVINDRPLTYVNADVSDPEPLTPSHIVYGKQMTLLPHNTFHNNKDLSEITSNHRTMTKHAEFHRRLLDNFRERWRREYLTGLREYHHAHGNNEQKISIGDVVQIHEDSARIRWKLAVVTELNYGNDGLIRSAVIKTKDGVTNRPITKLYPLEVFNDN